MHSTCLIRSAMRCKSDYCFLTSPLRVSLVLRSTTGGLWPIWQICWITANSSSLTIYSKDCLADSFSFIYFVHNTFCMRDCTLYSSTLTMSFLCVWLCFSFGSNLREFLLLEYASGLFTHHRYAHKYSVQYSYALKFVFYKTIVLVNW